MRKKVRRKRKSRRLLWFLAIAILVIAPALGWTCGRRYCQHFVWPCQPQQCQSYLEPVVWKVSEFDEEGNEKLPMPHEDNELFGDLGGFGVFGGLNSFEPGSFIQPPNTIMPNNDYFPPLSIPSPSGGSSGDDFPPPGTGPPETLPPPVHTVPVPAGIVMMLTGMLALLAILYTRQMWKV